MLRRLIYILLIMGIVYPAFSQEKEDTLFNKTMDEVIVTGTRTENKVSNVPLPIQVISAKNIQMSGSQKLLDILQMLSGLVIANNPLGTSLQGYPNPFGDGIQMQGLDPAYTLVMLDGEPLTGRNAGIINLGRIAVGNIKQVEILKGPATSLYGSDALAGVINIITKEPVRNEGNAQIHYGSNNTLGTTLSGNIVGKKMSAQLFANRLSSDGYDLDPNIYGQTVDPYTDYSFSGKLVYRINDHNKFTLSGRYFSNKQFNNYEIFADQKPEIVSGTTVEKDKSFFARWESKVSPSLEIYTTLYGSGYSNNASVYVKNSDSLFETITLDQTLLKPEIQANIGKNPKALFVTGIGYNLENVKSNRYGEPKELNAWYAFAQKQYLWNKFNFIAGARLDKSSLYPAQLSPKLAVSFKPSAQFIIKGSVGTGFKAPDFRQLYLDFSNSLIGYTLIGAHELGHGLEKLLSAGMLPEGSNITPYLNGLPLTPEKSLGVNLGFDYTINNKSFVNINFFRNDISNLIETYNLPFYKVNNQAIYSYMNVNKVFTEGVEANFSYKFAPKFSVMGGYQFLIAKDKEVVALIKEGKMFKRDPETFKTITVSQSDYKGLYNRSRHTANARLQYDENVNRFSAYLMAKYRGKYGFSGLNGYSDGNSILDDEREFVNGFILLNATVSKDLFKNWNFQAGVENILNYTNKLLMPNIYGRSFFVNCNFKLQK